MATRQLAAALAPRVAVFCVSPGWVKTDMGGDGAPLSAHDSVAGLIKVLDSATAATAGHFLDYTGKEIAW
jgi:NAD(P)-dependent dehydrogenase (short-subunit alcohol dehydrogenase family)